VHDESADIYLVSNVAGGPSDKDNNGFISRVSPSGEVEELRWISGGVGGVVLHAPKGLTLKGDSLFVADLDSVRIYHRETGESLGARGVPGAALLNDLAVGPDGTVYVTDTGVRITPAGIEQAESDAIYRFDASGAPVALASGANLQNPNGVMVDETGVIVLPFGGNEVYRLDGSGQRTTLAQMPGGQLDGGVMLPDGTLLISGWEQQSIYRIAPDGTVTTAIDRVDAPADIGYDATRGRLLVPLYNANQIEVIPYD
jgi:sugar lactone lactonase YvrE